MRGIKWHWYVAAGLCLIAASAVAQPDGAAARTQQIELQRVVHFTAPDGKPVTVAAGSYRVEKGEGAALRLVSADGGVVTVAAEAGEHDEELSVPEALSVAAAEDEHHVLLLHPDGTVLDASGSYSGVATRGRTATAKLPVAKVKSAYDARLKVRTPVYKARVPPTVAPGVVSTDPAIDSVSPGSFTIGDTVTIHGRNLQKAEPDLSINKFNQTAYWVKISNSPAVADGPALYTPGSFIQIHDWSVNGDGTVATFVTTGVSAYWPYRTLWNRSFSSLPSAQGGDRQPCDPGWNYVPSWTTPETVIGKLRLRARDLGNTTQNYWALASPAAVAVHDVEGCHPGVTECFADESFPNGLPCGWNQCRTHSCN